MKSNLLKIIAYPWLREKDIKVATWNYPTTINETLRYRTYKDLWERGFYVSSGEKFGGDFLAYPGKKSGG